MITDIKAKAQQLSAEAVSDADMMYLQGTRLGQLFTADWKTKLLLAGRLWRVTVGTIAASQYITWVNGGGGGGSSVDQDRPEFAIDVGTGYFLIPVDIRVACRVDIDADTEYGDIIVTTDRAARISASPTGTVETPTNLLDGAADFPGLAYSAITTAITDPTVSEILDMETVVAAGTPVEAQRLKLHFEPVVPTLLAGPCAIYGYWGGSGLTRGLASVVVGVIPASWAE